MSVLILASPKDLHAQIVSDHLQEMRVPVQFWELEQLLSTTDLQYSLSSDEACCHLDILSNGVKTKLDLMKFASVWLRRPGKLSPPACPEKWMESLIDWESRRALDAIFRAIPGLWVNPPASEREALLKLRQLDLARTCGLRIPDTLVTNSPESVRAFLDKHGGQIIYKLIDEASYRFFPDYEVVLGMPTMPFRGTDLEHLEQVRLSLHLFQQRVDKQSDIRITAVGEKLFPVEIFSQGGKGKVDFRLDYSVPMKTHELPATISSSCLLLLKRLGLTYGAFDFCLDKQGTYWFLEVNPAGQWLWMETGLNLPISLHMARLLAGLDPPLTS